MNREMDYAVHIPSGTPEAAKPRVVNNSKDDRGRRQQRRRAAMKAQPKTPEKDVEVELHGTRTVESDEGIEVERERSDKVDYLA
jgi:hypothetical protein